jgi:hypothetical protein
VVVGGAEIGAATVRRLLLAVTRVGLDTDRIVVVDRDPDCPAARIADPRVRLASVEWSDWLDAHLGSLGPDDHFVPYHWAPHLLSDWLLRQIRRAGALAERGGEIPSHGVPVERSTADGDRALSYATWICPPTCIEPALCPHTRGEKDWSLAGVLGSRREGDPFDGRIVFPCLHLVWGVGTVPASTILDARDRILASLGEGPRRYLVATSSHCHALATVLDVNDLTARAGRLLG